MSISIISTIKTGLSNIGKNLKNKPKQIIGSNIGKIKKPSPDVVNKFIGTENIPPKLNEKLLTTCVAALGGATAVSAVNSTTAKQGPKSVVFSTTA